MSIPIVNQTPATKELQFKLYATKFPVWWTHNSIDKPDPDYFKKLDLATDDTGFNWVEVPFTFNFKDQFTGTIVADDQYYTMFKLVDSKDTKYPNKYYLVESLNKAFNGGYELEIRLDVFTTYGLDFWTTHILNPILDNKSVLLKRTNNQRLLLLYYYYETTLNDLTFNNWMYLDPLLDFSNSSDIAFLANVYRNRNDIAYVEKYPLSAHYVITYENGNPKVITTQLNNTEYVLNGSSDPLYPTFGEYNAGVRYYVFKGLVGDSDMYWAIWTVKPRQYFTSQLQFTLSSSKPEYPNFELSLNYESVQQGILSAQHGYNTKFIGVFDGPPLGPLEYKFGMSGVPDSSRNIPLGQNNIELAVIDLLGQNFLVSKIYITPSRGKPSSQSCNNFFSVFGAVSDPNDPPLAGSVNPNLMSKKFNSEGEISFLTNSSTEIKNCPYVLQKAHINNLTYTPFHPMSVYIKRNLQWEPALSSLTDKLPKIEYARIKMPDVIFFTNNGFRLGYIDNNVGLSTTLWILPTSLPVSNNLFDTYMTSALTTQNTSLSIARQYQQFNIWNSAFNSSVSGGSSAQHKNAWGIISAIGNNIFNINKTILDYSSHQRMYNAQNQVASLTIAPTIKNSIDKDTSDQLMTSTSWYAFGDYQVHHLFMYLNCFNWIIKAKVPLFDNEIIYYNNLIYLNGFYVNRQISFKELALIWFNYVKGIMPHLYYELDINIDLLKLIYPNINNELLLAITTVLSSGIRFWKNVPDYSKPWYWLPGNPYLGPPE